MNTNQEAHNVHPHARAHQAQAEVGLIDYWRALNSQRFLIVVVTLAVLALVLVAMLLMTPKYRASSTLQIEREALNVVNLENLMPAESPQERDFYETQYELLRSRALARAVIRHAQLDKEPFFRDRVEQALEGLPEKPDPARRRDAVERALTGAVLEGLVIEPVRNSRLVRINYDSPEPALAAKIANAYAQVFIDTNQERRLAASALATRYLAERLQQLRAKVEDSEKNLVGYSGQERIVSVGEDQPSLPAQNLTELNARLAAAQEARMKAEAEWRQASGGGMGLPQVVSNPLVQTLRAEQAKLKAEQRQKTATFGPEYPEMKRINAQLAEADRQIGGEVGRIRQSLKATYEAASRQERLFTERIEALKGEELDLQGRSIRYNMLKRDMDTNRQLYDALLQRYKEIGVAGNIGSSNISIVDHADVPDGRHSPELAIGLVLGLVFGLLIGIAVALVRYFLKQEPAR